MKSYTSQIYCSPIGLGIRLLASKIGLHLLVEVLLQPLVEAIGAAAIRVRRVVVVGITAGVHIPRVVGIAAISGAQTAVLGLQPTPHTVYLNFAE
jgi:hypothetical protein